MPVRFERGVFQSGRAMAPPQLLRWAQVACDCCDLGENGCVELSESSYGQFGALAFSLIFWTRLFWRRRAVNLSQHNDHLSGMFLIDQA